VSVAARLTAFAAVLLLAFGGAALASSAIDPTDPEPAAAGAPGWHGGGDAHAPATPAAEGEAGDGEHGAGVTSASAAVAGLAVAEDGFALVPDRTAFAAGERAPLRLRITGPDERTVRDGFEVAHDRRLHLIVVRRDTAAFEHVHPEQAADGSWSIDLTLPAARVYRAFADFTIGGEQRTLATDLFVPGDFAPQPLPAPAATDRTGDLDVRLTAPRLRAGREQELALAVTRGGAPLAALDPYLGAKGHLVALREGDLAYLHVHPVAGGAAHAQAGGAESTTGHANEVRFAATFPTAGRYRLFLQVKTEGVVRTVGHTVEVGR